MSSTSGSNLNGASQAFLIEGGLVQTADGAQFDLTTEAGASEIRNVLNAAELDELEGLMRAQGYALQENRWVPNDSVMTRAEQVERAEQRRAQGLEGAQEVDAGMNDLDREVAQSFENADIPSPYNANTTPILEQDLAATPGYNAAVAAANTLMADHSPSMPTEPNTVVELSATSPAGEAATDLVTRHFKTLSRGNNIMEALFLVFRESIRQTNEDKKYFLVKLQEYNKMAEGLSDYLSELVEESQKLSESVAGAKYPEKGTIDITVRTFDTSTVGADGKAVQMSSRTAKVDRSALNDTIKNVEAMQETVRNKRQMASTAFQNFDQKANQLYNMLSSVLKVMNEMRSGTTRNML